MGRGRPKGRKDSAKRKPTSVSHRRNIASSVKEAIAKKKEQDLSKSRKLNQRFWTKESSGNVDDELSDDENSNQSDSSGSCISINSNENDNSGWSGQQDNPPATCDLEEEDEETSLCDEDERDLDDDNLFMTSIMMNYCQHIQKRLQAELATQGKHILGSLEGKWLKTYLETHDWWIRSYDAKTICKKLAIEFDEEWYYRDVFIWLPDARWGEAFMPPCPECNSISRVGFHAWRDNHYGRKIISLDRHYFAISRRYKCQRCLKTFMAWNERSLQLYPYGFGEKFPAILSWKSGIDKLVMNLARPLFDKGVRPSQLSDILLELHTKKYTDDYIEREYKIQQKQETFGNNSSSMFSSFNDRLKYDGTVPTGRYLNQMYVREHRKVSRHMDLEVKKRTSRRLHTDVSFKEAKLLCRYKGVPVFKGLCTVTNEYGEIRLQYHVVTDGHDQLQQALAAFKKTAECYGHPNIELIITDKPRQDKLFYHGVFPSLVESERKMNEHIVELEETDHLYKINEDQLICLQSPRDMQTVAIALKNELKTRSKKVMGLDCEWKVHTNVSSGCVTDSGSIDTIQLAYVFEDDCEQVQTQHIKCYILQVSRLRTLPTAVVELLLDKDITFVGVQIGGDISKIAKDFKLNELKEKCNSINLGKYCRERNLIENGRFGLSQIAKSILQRTLEKDDSIRMSDWSLQTLSKPQQLYAAMDAIIGLEIYLAAEKYPDLSLCLRKEDIINGLKVDIIPRRGRASSMMTRSAIGILADESTPLSYPTDILCNDSRTLLLTVMVETVLAPNLIIPHYKTRDKKSSLSDFGKTPFYIRLPLKMLRLHDARETVSCCDMNERETSIDQCNESNNHTTKPVNSDSFNYDDDRNDEDGILSESLHIDDLDEIDNSADDITPNLTTNEITMLLNLQRNIPNQSLMPTEVPLNHPKLCEPDLNLIDKYSSVVGDGFHVIDGIKISTKHSARKLFKVAFRDALFAWDDDTLRKLKRAMIDSGFPPHKLNEKKTELQQLMCSRGYSEEEITNDESLASFAKELTHDEESISKDMFYNPQFYKECIPRIILPPTQLYWRVRAVFVVFGDLMDTATKQPLFNDFAWRRANNILKLISHGLISDPKGLSFYSIVINSDGSPKKNKYGFQILRSNRGTNDVENIHRHLTATYRNWVVGIEQSDCLMRERRHRHNHKASVRNRFGYPDIGHYDTWKIDLLQNLVEENHNILLYPGWTNASDMKQTDESLGTVALHDLALHEALQKYTAEQPTATNERHFSHEMKYLMKTMGTTLPFLPIVEIEEKTLFNKLILDFFGQGSFDAIKMSIEWCKHVNGLSIFPKLPVHLRVYFTAWEKNHNAQEVQVTTLPIVDRLYTLFGSTSVITDGGMSENGSPTSTNEEDEAAPVPPADASVDNRSIVVRNTMIPRPMFPAAIPNITHMMMHTRESTAVGNIIIYHNNNTNPSVQFQRRRKGQRGKDKSERKWKPCKSCGNDTCKGKYPNGKCSLIR